MSQEQYDLSREMRELFNRKQEQRAAAKEFWRKQLFNPYLQEEPFDPVFFRYVGLSTYSAEHYRETFKRKTKFLFLLTPFVLFGYYVTWARNKQEAQWRSGTIAYEDRTRKLLY